VSDYEKETHDREVQLYILYRLFNLSSLGSATPFWAHENLVVLTSADLFIHKCVSWNRPHNDRMELGRLRMSEHARSEGGEWSRQESRLACATILHQRKSSRSTRGFRSLAKPCPNHTPYPFRDPKRRDTPRSLRDRLPFSAFSGIRDF